MDSFKLFTPDCKRCKPLVYIRKGGTIGFSRGTIDSFSMNNFKYVQLYFNEKEKKVAIELTNNQSLPGIKALTKYSAGYQLHANAFLKYNDILFSDHSRKYRILTGESTRNRIVIKVETIDGGIK